MIPADTIIPRKKTTANDSVYNVTLAKAQNFYLNKNYTAALTEYEKALKIKPEDSRLKETVEKVKSLITQQNKSLEDYQRTIASADNYFKAKDYLDAKNAYQLALDLKPDDPYAKERLKQTLELIRSQKAQNTLYDMAIASAEKLFQAREYEKAKVEFEKAKKILPDDKYANERINEIIKILVDKATTDEMYASAIASADKFYIEKKYQASLKEYQTASVYKPEEKYPKEKIAEVTELIKAMKAKDDAYNKSIAAADQLFNATSYPNAKKEYQNALTIKPEESYPAGRIREIDNILAGKQKITEDYNRLVDKGDSLYMEKKYIAAKANYQQALKLKPAESYPKEMISKADNMIAGQAASEQAAEEAYQLAVKNADDWLKEKSFEKAKTEYQNALLIKPNEGYPKTKISEIDKILAEVAKQKSLDEQYAGLIAQADKKLSEKAYPDAKTDYQSALKIKPDQQYPKDKIREIDNVLAEIEKQKGIDERYAASIARADKLLNEKSLELARTEFNNAANLKPEEAYPKKKIAEIDKLFADAAAEAKAKDEQYKTFIDQADKLLAEKSYEQSRSEYQNALAVKPDENYPKTKVSEIDQLLAEIARQKSLDEHYAGLIASADKLLSAKSYSEAKAGYEEALKIKPDEQYPKNKIGEIDLALAEIASLKALDDQYSEAIKNADQYFSEKKLEQAKTGYIAAGNLKPGESYPGQRIKEIDKLLADAAAQKALDEKYQIIILNADSLLTAKDYNGAKNEYSSALKVKPGEQYPKDKIAEIESALASIAEANAKDAQYKSIIDKADKLLAAKSYEAAKAEYQSALMIKPGEAYPQEKVAEIDIQLETIAKQKALDDQYAGLITDGDKKLAEKSYEEAKAAYQSAVDLKPDQQYAKGKISEIDKALADISRRKALDEQYNSSIAKAEQLLADKLLDESKAEFIAAGNLKPGESYPKEKIAEINRLKEQIAQQKILDGKFEAAIQSADNYLSAQNYNNAKIKYSEALTLKPDQQYPKDKIQEIETILAELKAKEESYKASVAKADQLLAQKSYEEARNEYTNATLIKPEEQYPQNKIAEINNILMEIKGKRETYDELVVKGDDYFNQKDFYRSQDNFRQASDIFPEETYPKQRLNRINSIIDSIYRANKGKYDKAISDGDKAYNSLIYDKALDFYGEALTYLPMEKYPKEMISKIKRAIAENAIVDVLNTPVVITQGDEKQMSFEPINIASRKNNYLYIKIKNLSDKPFNVLVRYGRDNQTNGGAVIRNLQGDGNIYDRLISVRDQDPWYREDNNWIALLPQGGDVEVSFVQISRVVQ